MAWLKIYLLRSVIKCTGFVVSVLMKLTKMRLRGCLFQDNMALNERKNNSQKICLRQIWLQIFLSLLPTTSRLKIKSWYALICWHGYAVYGLPMQPKTGTYKPLEGHWEPVVTNNWSQIWTRPFTSRQVGIQLLD